MSEIESLADEFDELLPNVPIRLTAQAQRTVVGALRMVEKVDVMMAALGADGSIGARDDRVQAVMDLLNRVDPK